jgi:hypothetical protein
MSIVKLSNNGVKNATALGSISSLGSMIFIKKLTASSSATLSFVDGSSDVTLDNSYKEYLFTFNNIHPETNTAKFTFQGNAAGGSGYDETITSTFHYAYHDEADSEAGVSYYGGGDQAQGTAFQRFSSGGVGNGNDECTSGYLHLFNPSDTTFVTHFISRNSTYQDNNSVNDNYVAGYFNTTSAIDEIQFKFDSGDIDAGDICLYGIL